MLLGGLWCGRVGGSGLRRLQRRYATQFDQRFGFAITRWQVEQCFVQILLSNLGDLHPYLGRADVAIVKSDGLVQRVSEFRAPGMLVNHSIRTALAFADRRKRLLTR